jgi:hypothetical protein
MATKYRPNLAEPFFRQIHYTTFSVKKVSQIGKKFKGRPNSGHTECKRSFWVIKILLFIRNYILNIDEFYINFLPKF